MRYSLELGGSLIYNWYVDNYMKINDDKSHFLKLGSKEEAKIKICSSIILMKVNMKSCFVLS